MRKVYVFMMVSLDGFFEGQNHDLSWHHVDEEFNAFAGQQLQHTGALLFGSRTYELMFDYWPTAKPYDKNDAIVAQKMNTLPKIVFSKTLKKVEEHENWKNIRLVGSDVARVVGELKSQKGQDIGVLGSSNLCVSLLEYGLLDELRIMINPVVIGRGTPLFDGLKEKRPLKFEGSRIFKSGNILTTYSPI